MLIHGTFVMEKAPGKPESILNVTEQKIKVFSQRFLFGEKNFFHITFFYSAAFNFMSSRKEKC